MTLRRGLAAGLAIVAVFCFGHNQASAAQQKINRKPGFSIAVSAPTNPLRLSEPVNVTITVTNVTDHNIYWLSGVSKQIPYGDYSYSLERDGHEVGTTSFYREISVHGPPSYVLLPHPPGTIFKIEMNLKCLYQITEPGNYNFQVSRYDQATKTTVRSNTVSLTINP